ncbi:MAG: NAD+ synthetase, partial [Bdellovibrionota bacterium]
IGETGCSGLEPVRAFKKVLAKAPTAELRPAEQHQTDEDDLMPYDVLDAIERMAIRDKRSPKECLELLKGSYPQVEPKLAISWVTKFFRLWCRNQWKRERYAPAFHLDDESLDPKTWCRFPILSSGFEEELRELQL